MYRRRKKRPLSLWMTVLIDLAAIGLAFYVFALFHHIIPREGGGPITKTADIAPVETERPEEEGIASAATQPVRQPGDFSDTFPSAEPEGAKGAYRYYRDGNVQVLIEKVERSGVTYYTADVWVKNISYLKTAFAKGKYGRGIHESVPDMARDNGAIVAVSGDYYGAHENGIVIRNGYLYRDKSLDDVCVLYQTGELVIHERENIDLGAIIENNAYQAWSFGPKLLENGEWMTLDNHSLSRQNPRCAIGYYEPGHYIFVVVDGRQEGYSKGLTLTQLSKLMKNLGCAEAYNLDGGQTACMVFNGEFANQPVNGGRKSSDIIYIGG